MVLDMAMRDGVEREIEQMRNAKRIKLADNRASTELVENLHGRATAREFTFDSDEPEYVTGGQNRGPRPLEYFLAGWAFCQQVQYARNALLAGTPLDGLELEASGDVDPTDFLDDDPSAFAGDELRLTAHIESDASREEIRDLVQQAQSDCYAHGSLEREMTLTTDVHLNDEPLDL